MTFKQVLSTRTKLANPGERGHLLAVARYIHSINKTTLTIRIKAPLMRMLDWRAGERVELLFDETEQVYVLCKTTNMSNSWRLSEESNRPGSGKIAIQWQEGFPDWLRYQLVVERWDATDGNLCFQMERPTSPSVVVLDQARANLLASARKRIASIHFNSLKGESA